MLVFNSQNDTANHFGHLHCAHVLLTPFSFLNHNQCYLRIWSVCGFCFVCTYLESHNLTPRKEFWLRRHLKQKNRELSCKSGPSFTAEPASDVRSPKSSELHHWFNLQGWAASDHNAQRKLAASALQRPALPLDFACSVEKEKEGKDKKNTPAMLCVWASHNCKTASSAQRYEAPGVCSCVCVCVRVCVCACLRVECVCVCVCVF